MHYSKPVSRRSFLKLASAGAAVTALAACVAPASPGAPSADTGAQGGAPSAERQKIVVQGATWFVAKLPSLNTWKEQYESEFPDREVEILREDYDFTKAALEASQGSSHSDLLLPLTAFIELVQSAEAGVLAPITDLLPPDWKQAVPEAFVQESVYDGDTYLWPYGQIGSVNNYRKSILEQVGAADAPGETLDDFLEVCAAIQANVTAADGSQVYGNSFDLAWWRAPTTIGINMMGRDFFGAEGYLAWDDPGLPEVFSTIKRLSEYASPEIFQPGYSSVEAFGAGKSAMFLGQSEQVFYLTSSTFGLEDLGLAYPPLLPGGESNPRTIVASGGAAFLQNGNVENAWHFFEWLWPQEAFHQAIATEGQWIPVHLDYMDAEWVPPLVQQLIGLIQTGTFIPPTLHYLALATHARNALTDYLLGNIATPEEAIAAAKQNFEDAVRISG
jgi:ABC-type glycerol-3-phosphate transport system substrate-binding protein